jgi:hypothetical protein
MSLYVTNENGKRWFKLEGQGCLAFPEDAWVQVLEHRIKQKDAMIDWLADLLDELVDMCPTDAPCQDGKSCPPEGGGCCAKCWIKAAEKAVQDAD